MIDYEKPACTAPEVLERACALAGIVTVYTVEKTYPQASPSDRQELSKSYDSLSRVYRSTPPTGVQLSPTERVILEKPIGTWSDADKLNVGWRTECAAVLGWAVGVIDTLAPYDQMAAYDCIRPLTDYDIRKGNVTLRAPELLDQALKDAEQWHWRARQVQPYFPSSSIDTLTGQAAGRRRDIIRRALGDESRLFEKPYEELTFMEWSLACSIASERHHALSWLWDGGPWDEVITDT